MNAIKQANMSAVLRNLLHLGPISRVQLAENTALSNTTITNLTSELLESDIIAELGGAAGGARRRVGRPRTMLQLNGNARFVIGIHISVGFFRVAIVNLRAVILETAKIDFDRQLPAATVLQLIEDHTEQLIARSGIKPDQLIGIGVGLSGLVDRQRGINLYAPRLGWRNIDIRASLNHWPHLPVTIDNNVQTMALAEAFFGAGRDVSTLAVLYGRVGVGSGFVIKGTRLQGSGIGTGELGHNVLIPAPFESAAQQAGQHDTLETLVSEAAIVRAAEAAVADAPESLLGQLLPDQAVAHERVERVFAAARRGDPAAMRIMDHTGYYLGIAMANIVNLINPELILFGGIFNSGADLLLEPATATMRQAAFAHLADHVRVESTSFGWRAPVIGAAAVALTEFVYQPSS